MAAHRTNGAVEISVSDTGLGLPPEYGARDPTTAASGSYGLLHVRERLRAAYGAQASLTLTSQEPAGVCATVRMTQ